ncbi:MAG TPA: hypothetical protein VK705_11115 [Ferruginibacter sp.]|nr:hypothetical protein [Ferruginibacter sp.]
MEKVTGTIISKEIHESHSLKGHASFAISIQTDMLPYRLGIQEGTSRRDAYDDSMNTILENGKIYTFYINPTYPIIDGVIDRVSRVDYNGRILYRHPEVFNIIFSCAMILVGLFAIIFSEIRYYKVK